MPTLLVALPEQERSRLEGTLFARADMRRTMAEPSEVFAIARTLGPDLILLSAAGGLDGVKDLVEQLRREPVTHDAIVIVVLGAGDVGATVRGSLERAGVGLVLPHGFSESVAEVPWAARLEELLHLRQRREARVLAEIPVQAVITPEGSPPRPLTATCLNLSSRGMLMETPELLPRGARAELSFRATPTTAAIEVVGEVVRTAETADGRRLAGVHFVVVRKEARLAIRDLLRSERGSE